MCVCVCVCMCVCVIVLFVHLYTRVKLCESLIELRRLLLFCVADCTLLLLLLFIKKNDLVDKKLS